MVSVPVTEVRSTRMRMMSGLMTKITTRLRAEDDADWDGFIIIGIRGL